LNTYDKTYLQILLFILLFLFQCLFISYEPINLETSVYILQIICTDINIKLPNKLYT